MSSRKKKSVLSAGNGIWRGLLWWCALVSALLLTLCGAATFVNPARFPPLGVFVLGFPFFLVATLVFILICLFLHVKRWWIVGIILLLNAWCVRIYFPMNLPQDVSSDCLKVLSFNVQNLFVERGLPADSQPVARYILDSGADIVCLQEAPNHHKSYFKHTLPVLKQAYAYRDSLKMKSSSYLDVYSRLPILKCELVADGKTNQCAAFTLLDGADTLIVVNCHLRSMHLSLEEKANFSGIVHDADTLSVGDKKRGSVLLVTKIASASVERAAQVDELCRYLERQKGKRIILCGDFNDTPISYAHNRISSYLTDCYAATATGFGRSFNANSMLVRIDYMFCSSHFKPYGCQIDQSILLSDHYPISCTFQRRK